MYWAVMPWKIIVAPVIMTLKMIVQKIVMVWMVVKPSLMTAAFAPAVILAMYPIAIRMTAVTVSGIMKPWTVTVIVMVPHFMMTAVSAQVVILVT